MTLSLPRNLSFVALLVSLSGVATAQSPKADGPSSLDSLAREQLRLGRFVQARALYEQALSTNSQSLSALTGVGDIYALTGDYVAAQRSYERLLRASGSLSDTVQAFLRIAEALTFAGDIGGAEGVVKSGIQQSRRSGDKSLELALITRLNALQRWNGQLSEAETTIAEMERIGTHESFSELTRRTNALRSAQLLAMVYAKRGDAPSAKRLAEEYIHSRERAGLPPQREMTLGLVASYLGHHTAAIDFLERAPETAMMAYLQYYLGVAHEAIGHVAKAQEYFERVTSWRSLEPVDRLQLPLVRDLARKKLRVKQ